MNNPIHVWSHSEHCFISFTHIFTQFKMRYLRIAFNSLLAVYEITDRDLEVSPPSAPYFCRLLLKSSSIKLQTVLDQFQTDMHMIHPAAVASEWGNRGNPTRTIPLIASVCPHPYLEVPLPRHHALPTTESQ
ncbi:hypothetical protein BLNAU_3987 [Blattamonas nauphoetae]|uniref:Uncharacterized protein n=1 Tax=Blattamonas nauphoetae TaxID=2049346 RepID=A0ABQ9YB00_9EUKA|nr:hypothetical protein BLNAU_3987 [Blattamonas nauphoetae]